MEVKDLDIENEPFATISVNFSLRSEALVPAEITKQMGIEPSHAFMKGDEFDSRSGKHRHPWGIWQLRSNPAVLSGDVAAHVDYILGILGPNRKVIEGFLKDSKYYVEVRIRWSAAYPVCSYSLPSNLLTRLAAVCNQLVVSCVMHPIENGAGSIESEM